MGIIVYSFLWVVQDFVHQPYLFCRGVFLSPGLWCRGFTRGSLSLSLCLQRPGGGVTSLHIFLYLFLCFCLYLALALSLSLSLSLPLSLLSNWLLYYTTVLKRPFRVCKCPAKMDPPECNCEGLMAVSQNELLHVLWGVCYTTNVITTLLQMLSGSLHAKPQDTARSAGRSSHSPYKLQV